MQTKKSDWDYAQQAKYYRYRPNYADEAIDELCLYVSAKRDDRRYVVADVGAGTGNLTMMLLKRGLKCLAIEPTKEMMDIGKENTNGSDVEWRKGTGEHTSLADGSVDWFTMGSSFNTTDRPLTLTEAWRVLKPSGYFSCMWNHRDIENDPTQKRIEEIIETVIPSYERGVRREGQADVILSSLLFNDVHYIEKTQIVRKTVDEYIDAWKSVKNKYWDLETEDGRVVFEKIVARVREKFSALEHMELRYTTRIWTARALS